MADEIDLACEREQWDNGLCVAAAREAAAHIPVGEAGECDLCGEYTGRLVNGACAPCRDKYKLP